MTQTKNLKYISLRNIYFATFSGKDWSFCKRRIISSGNFFDDVCIFEGVRSVFGFPDTCVYFSSVHAYLVDPASGICLSQRLSHASLSMSILNNETANGSVKQL